jgi:hypothetical protein
MICSKTKRYWLLFLTLYGRLICLELNTDHQSIVSLICFWIWHSSTFRYDSNQSSCFWMFPLITTFVYRTSLNFPLLLYLSFTHWFHVSFYLFLMDCFRYLCYLFLLFFLFFFFFDRRLWHSCLPYFCYHWCDAVVRASLKICLQYSFQHMSHCTRERERRPILYNQRSQISITIFA